MNTPITVKTTDTWQGKKQPTIVLQIVGVNAALTPEHAQNLIENLEAAIERVAPEYAAERTVI
jgi:hypothetical protein